MNVSVYVVYSFYLWHGRLTHLNYKSIEYLHTNNYIDLRNKNFEKKCKICIQFKITKKPFPKVERCTQVLEHIHRDLCGLKYITRGGKKCFMTFIDGSSRYTYVYLLRNKDDMFEMFKRYKLEVENYHGIKIKLFCSDRGGGYLLTKSDSFCETNSIMHQSFSLVDRKTFTLVDIGNSMLLNAKLPHNQWSKALLLACHIHNRIPWKTRKVSPYEIWTRRKPNQIILKYAGI